MGILMSRFPQHLIYDSSLHKNATVSTLIRDGRWAAPAYIQAAIQDIYNDLPAVELDVRYEDEIIWKGGNDGEFSNRSAYHATRHRETTVPWARLVWFKGRIPRHSFITWLVLHKALKTQDKLKAWNKIDVSLCSLCKANEENEAHLFFGYNHTPLAWQQEVEWCLQHFSGSSACTLIKKLAFNTTIYHLWQERNNRIFQLKRKAALDLVHRIVEDIRLRISVLDLNIEDNAHNRNFCERWRVLVNYVLELPKQYAWTPPEQHWYMINSDGSLTGASGGYGAIIRDHDGVTIAAGAGSTDGRTVTLHELQGVELGIKLANQYGLQKVIFCTDSANVHKYITTRKPPPWDAWHIVRRIKRVMGEFEQHKVIHGFRETNQAADKLSKLMPNSEFIEITPSSFAEDLKKIIFDDAIGRKYYRM